MMNKLRRNVKALSPIFATLILIAIAVIAGIIVYMFTSGTLASMMGGGTAGQEKAAIQGVTASATHNGLTAYAQYVEGGNPITINGAIVRDVNGTQYVGTVATAVVLPVDGSLQTVTVTGISPVMLATHTYTVTLTSSKGGSFVSSSFPG